MHADGDTQVAPDLNRFNRWELGKRGQPSPRFRRHIIKVFGMSAEELGLSPNEQSRPSRIDRHSSTVGSRRRALVNPPVRAWKNRVGTYTLATQSLMRLYKHRPLLGLFTIVLTIASVTLVSLTPWSTAHPAQPGRIPPPSSSKGMTTPRTKAPDGLTEQLGAANISQGANTYSFSTSMEYDQVAKVQLAMFNPTYTTIYDVIPSVNLPSQAGISQTVGISLSDADGDSTTQSLPFTLDRASASLVYEPGTVVWKHFVQGASGPIRESTLPDRVLTNGAPLMSLAPRASATLTLLVREEIPAINVSASGHGPNNPTWSTNFLTPLGGNFDIRVTIQDTGDTPLTEVFVADSLPSGAHYVLGSARVNYSSFGAAALKQKRLSSGIIVKGTLASSVGVPLPPVPLSGYFATALNGRPASLLPGQTAIVTLEANMASSSAGAVSNTVQVRWHGNPTQLRQTLMLSG